MLADPDVAGLRSAQLTLQVLFTNVLFFHLTVLQLNLISRLHGPAPFPHTHTHTHPAANLHERSSYVTLGLFAAFNPKQLACSG